MVPLPVSGSPGREADLSSENNKVLTGLAIEDANWHSLAMPDQSPAAAANGRNEFIPHAGDFANTASKAAGPPRATTRHLVEERIS